MKPENNKIELNALRGYLVRRFLLALAVVTGIEFVVIGLMNRLFFPVLQRYFFAQGNWTGKLSVSQIIILLLLWLVELFLAAIHSMLPLEAGYAIRNATAVVEEFQKKSLPDYGQGMSLLQMEGGKAWIFFFVLLGMVGMLLLPYAVGAVWYGRIASKHVQKLQENRDNLQREYERRRNLMLSDIAHDLRTPMTTVTGYSKALLDGMVEDEGKRQEYLEAIQRKSVRMNELIFLLFEYVKLDSEGFDLDRKPIDLTELLRQNAAMMYSDVEEAGMELVAEIPEKPCMIYADEIQFPRVITNLIVNALRHNEPGTRIVLSLKEQEGRVFVAVADNGVSIPEEVAEHLFEPFAVGDESRNSKGGSGLGLSIAHKIMEMHGWQLQYTNVYPGCTKAFYLEIS